MRILKLLPHFGLIWVSCILTAAVQATPVTPTYVDCKLSDIQITSIQKQDGSGAIAVSPIDATACYGAFGGNDDVSNLGNNLGYKDVGFLNKSLPGYWPGPGAFVTNADLQDLEIAGNFKDPGWIFFGKMTDGVFAPSSSSKGSSSYTYTSDLVSLNNCKDKNGNTIPCTGSDIVSGEWTYKPPVTNPQTLLDLLGSDKFFDAVTVVFKSGNSFAMYNFNLAALGLPPVVGTSDENFLFKGVWSMKDTLFNNGGNPAGLSHISVWGRDPTDSDPDTKIPVPGTLLLAGLGLLLLSVRRYR